LSEEVTFYKGEGRGSGSVVHNAKCNYKIASLITGVSKWYDLVHGAHLPWIISIRNLPFIFLARYIKGDV
jgi:hypothetical protein